MRKDLTVIDATRRLGISLDALYRLIYAGKLDARKVDGRWVVSGPSVEARLKRKEEHAN